VIIVAMFLKNKSDTKHGKKRQICKKYLSKQMEERSQRYTPVAFGDSCS
jgi:hypothetical protein